MPVEVLVESIEWDRDRIAGVAYESSVELLNKQIGLTNNDRVRIAAGFRDLTQLPFVDVRIQDKEGDDILVFEPPLDYEIIPTGDDIDPRTPEARLRVSPTVFVREVDTFYTRNKWEILRKTLVELANAFDLRQVTDTLEVKFPTRIYAREVRLRKVVLF